MNKLNLEGHFALPQKANFEGVFPPLNQRQNPLPGECCFAKCPSQPSAASLHFSLIQAFRRLCVARDKTDDEKRLEQERKAKAASVIALFCVVNM